jgi:hypothetical protein
MKRILSKLGPIFLLILNACNLALPSPIPLSTATPSVENTAPIPGDLGFGKITGKVTDVATGSPIPGANMKCEHFSYTSREKDRCHQITATDAEGNFLFEHVFFHDTDTITLIVNATGYKPFSQKYAQFTQPLLETEIQLSE